MFNTKRTDLNQAEAFNSNRFIDESGLRICINFKRRNKTKGRKLAIIKYLMITLSLSNCRGKLEFHASPME